MAYRRRQGIARASTFKEEIYNIPPADDASGTSSSSSQSLAAQAIRASAARRDSSFYRSHHRSSSDPLAFQQGRATYGYTPLRTTNDQAGGFWGVLAREAKSILNEDNMSEHFAEPTQMPYNSSYSKNDQYYNRYQSLESPRKVDNPTNRNGFNALTSSINQIGGTIGNALEEGQSMVENKTQDINQETQKMQIRRKGTNLEASGACNPRQEPLPYSSQPLLQSNQQTQLKASRDVAMATAAKAKLLLRELKTVKADLAFAKQRCSQLEEENKILREAHEKGDHPADDDMIRLQLETLLAEKARLAHENSVLARENRFLREIVEYHQLTMQDLVYLDEGIEEDSEAYPVPAVSGMLSVSPPSPGSLAPVKSPLRSPSVAKESSQTPFSVHTKSSQSNTTPAPASAPTQLQTKARSNDTAPAPVQLQSVADVPASEAPPSSSSSVSSPIARAGQPNSSS